LSVFLDYGNKWFVAYGWKEQIRSTYDIDFLSYVIKIVIEKTRTLSDINIIKKVHWPDHSASIYL